MPVWIPTLPIERESRAWCGAWFGRAYPAAPAITPSVAAILGATFPFSRCPENGTSVESLTLTLPSEPGELGYVTAGFSANPRVSPRIGFAKNFAIFWNARDYPKDYPLILVPKVLLEGAESSWAALSERKR